METAINSDEENINTSVSTQSLVAFGVAITLHSFIDGLAIGVFNEVGAIAVLAISVVIHKVPVACSVGTTFLAHGKHWSYMASLFTFIFFIIASPVGMIAGMILGDTEENMALVSIQAISGGTFVYLACCDLLIHEFHSYKHSKKEQAALVTEQLKSEYNKKQKFESFIKFCAVIAGASVVIALVSVADPHAH